VKLAGEASTFPSASRARAASVCAPSRSLAVNGETQGTNAPPSRLHSMVEPGSVIPRIQLTRAFFFRVLTFALPDTEVSGAVASTLKERVAGLAS
jgi:hypothetical protein